MYLVVIGRGDFTIPFMNGGRLPSGGRFVRASYAGCWRGGSILRSRLSAKLLLVLWCTKRPWMERTATVVMAVWRCRGIEPFAR